MYSFTLHLGGTVDITVHEVVNDNAGNTTLKELFSAYGGNCGGVNVDEAFIGFLGEVLGADTMEVVQTRYREDYISVLDTFELKKRQVTPDSTAKDRISLPVSFATTYESMNKEKLENTSRLPIKYKGKVNFDKGKLSLTQDVMRGFFENTCNTICALADEYLQQNRRYNIDKILMVGGFSESAILQDKVRKKFPKKRLIIPGDAGLAVLKGAVIYGHNPSMVVERVCKLTYGICSIKHFEPALDPSDKKIVRNKVHVLCKDRFSIHAVKGQSFKTDAVVGENIYVPSDPKSTEMLIDVYTSPRTSPRFIDEADSRKIGHLKVPLGDVRTREKDVTVKVQFVFGNTELGIIATVNDIKTKASFNFLNTNVA